VTYFGLIFRYFPGGCDETHEKLTEDSYYPGEILKLTPSKHTPEMLALQPDCSVKITVFTK
jgi:hypothetical protein